MAASSPAARHFLRYETHLAMAVLPPVLSGAGSFFRGRQAVFKLICLSLPMCHDTRYGPAAQTAQQRRQVLRRLLAACPQPAATPEVEQLYARYVAGELSWQQVQELRTALGPVIGRRRPNSAQ